MKNYLLFGYKSRTFHKTVNKIRRDLYSVLSIFDFIQGKEPPNVMVQKFFRPKKKISGVLIGMLVEVDRTIETFGDSVPSCRLCFFGLLPDKLSDSVHSYFVLTKYGNGFEDLIEKD